MASRGVSWLPLDLLLEGGYLTLTGPLPHERVCVTLLSQEVVLRVPSRHVPLRLELTFPALNAEHAGVWFYGSKCPGEAQRRSVTKVQGSGVLCLASCRFGQTQDSL